MPPIEIRLRPAKDALEIAWADLRAELAAEYLRVESPSAEVKGHGLGQGKLVSGKKSVTIAGLEPVGAYAVKIIFSDGHGTGLFTWAYLRELAEQKETRWAAYLADLEKAGLNRDVAGRLVLRADLR